MPSAESGALLGSGAVLVWNDIAEGGRQKFYDWHDKEHIPERLGIRGFLRGRRYVKPDHSPEWFTMYEATDLDVLTSPEYLERLNSPTPATRQALKYFRNTSRAVCRLAFSMGSSSGGYLLTSRLHVPAGKGDALSGCVRDELFPRALALTGVVACHLYAADRAASYANTAESREREFTVPEWILLAELTTSLEIGKLEELISGPALATSGIRPDAAPDVYALEICRLAPPDRLQDKAAHRGNAE